ncbi:Cof-type HAD-IIB family hydrolase [Streptococcus porcinus]|uniref:Cof-type HAD-IIB family hydrolase n=1 Tax=Streptococcus porcinus TaxID=1340 RepID=UPI00195FE14F|nr:Cof-type HAD-IIB family hydrolase [Streptococcus porcinus]
MTISKIFLDMDGTLLNSRGRISETNAQAILKAEIPITLVSARAPMEMKEANDSLELKGLQIGFNGGLIYRYHNDQLETFSEEHIPKTEANFLIKYLQEKFPNLSQSYYFKNDWISFKTDAGLDFESQLTQLKPSILPIEKYLNPNENIFKIMLITFDPFEMQLVRENLIQLGLEAITIQQSGHAYLEITSREAIKSKGIDYIIHLENLQTHQLAAFGDGHNDLPMFEKVGTAIAMANASEHIRKKAKLVTKSNDQDGVAYGIWQYLKGKR